MGLVALMVNAMVASSSPVGGSGMLQCLLSLVFYCSACYTSMHFIQFLGMFMFMGLVSRIVNSMVASSSPVGGLGTLHGRLEDLVEFPS